MIRFRPGPDAGPFRIAIVGGGMAGTLTAIRLLRDTRAPLAIQLFEPRAEVGRGLAYGTPDPAHYLNGPALNFSLFPEAPEDFSRWLVRRGHAAAADADETFAPRSVYGDYLQDTLARALAGAAGRATLEHIRTEIADLAIGVPHRVHGADGRAWDADHIVLATGVQPARPALARDPALEADGRYVPDPWQPAALAALAGARAVALAGTSLTMLDVVATLERLGFGGTYHAFSRRALLPWPRHGAGPCDDFLAAAGPAALARPTARDVVRRVRAQCRALDARGLDWQSVPPALREHVGPLWAAASVPERQRFLRHARPFWDNLLHRAAAPTHAVLAAVRAQGRLQVHAARVTGVEDAGGRLALRLSRALPAVPAVDALVNCTGAEYGWHAGSERPLVRNLLARGIVRPAAAGSGVDGDARGTVFDRGGRAVPGLSALGAPLRGALWESGTIIDVRNQAAALAARLAQELALATQTEAQAA
ncbi:FAD/NAD(P)-binding protein [Cupriavidus sp. 30B13]|uniref:FAD/NAD(P)-binding protein n=1 Tax=Cupriavidus sp. 30B13 TaxID=3384241 RepID=UPI003B8FB2BB